jgi:hypothetical protein
MTDRDNDFGALSGSREPEREPILMVSGFLSVMHRRFRERAALSDEGAIIAAWNSLEAWETMGEAVELTEDCAHEIVDSELEHWDAD